MPKPGTRATPPEMSPGDLLRITMKEDLYDELTPEDPYDPEFVPNERAWTTGTMTRRKWLMNEYSQKYGTKKPWALEGSTMNKKQWLAKTIEKTFRARPEFELGDMSAIKEFAADESKWWRLRPSDRYGDSARSALLPDPPNEIPEVLSDPPTDAPKQTTPEQSFSMRSYYDRSDHNLLAIIL